MWRYGVRRWKQFQLVDGSSWDLQQWSYTIATDTRLDSSSRFIQETVVLSWRVGNSVRVQHVSLRRTEVAITHQWMYTGASVELKEEGIWCDCFWCEAQWVFGGLQCGMAEWPACVTPHVPLQDWLHYYQKCVILVAREPQMNQWSTAGDTFWQHYQVASR